jgi:catechol 2,3-dioxygenase-like lactoylglutathione lyase family enzyme
MSNRDIARRRGISLDAVKFHVDNARGKLGLARRIDLRHWRGAPIGSPRPHRESPMVTTLSLGRLGQISREVADLDRAVAWFRDVLGLPLLGHYGTLATFDMAGVRLFVTRREPGNPTGNSILYFGVEDIEAAADALQARGVAFRGAPHMIHRHPDGTEEWMAFFDDPEGQPLALMSQVRGQHPPARDGA